MAGRKRKLLDSISISVFNIVLPTLDVYSDLVLIITHLHFKVFNSLDSQVFKHLLEFLNSPNPVKCVLNLSSMPPLHLQLPLLPELPSEHEISFGVLLLPPFLINYLLTWLAWWRFSLHSS